jgi:nicotinamide-nucleotide amidase
VDRPTAAIVTVGTELTSGLRADTNGREIAGRLLQTGYSVGRLTSVPDDETRIADAIADCVASFDLVVVTGGLGPTHDDRTREAAARALGIGLVRDPDLERQMAEIGRRHTTAAAATAALRQADVLDGARVVPAVSGTAPGQVITQGGATLVLLPGPPAEMRPMLEVVLDERASAGPPRVLRCAGITESDAGALVEPLLETGEGVGFTLLASPPLVDVVFFDDGAGAETVDRLALAAATALGTRCYSTDGRSLAEVVLGLASDSGVRIACAESCTGGSIAAALTDVPGASAVFLGGVVSYADTAKADLLGVPAGMLAQFGAVSEQVAAAMAEGARERFGAGLALSVTGIAGPDGGTADKPVGLVWFALASVDRPTATFERRFPGDRAVVRARATVHGLDLMRHALAGD